MAAWTVMLRGIRYRAGRSLVVFLLALVATTAAVLAPVYSRAAQQSVLTDGLRAASADATSLVVNAAGETSRDTDDIKLSVNQALDAQPVVADRLSRSIAATDTDTVLTGRGDDMAARLAYRDNACAHLRLTGECPEGPGQVVVSDRSAAAHGIAVGDRIKLRLGARNAGSEHEFQVVGRYVPKDPTEAYWGRTVYFAAGATEGESAVERVDAVFTGDPDDLRKERTAELNTRLEYPIDTGDVGLDEVAGLRDGITALATRLRTDDLELTTALPSILGEAAADQAAIGRTAPVIAVPLLLLCWFVLFLLVAALTEERGPEIALAKLRGFAARRAAGFGLGEALLLIVVATPFGMVAGVALVELAGRVVLADGTHAQLRWPAFVAAAGALLGAAAATLLAGRATVRRPVLDLLRRVPERTRWRAGLVEGLVVALAGASLFAAVGDRSAPLALLAAPLVALVAGIATARVLGIWARLRLRGARRRGRLVTLLASAQLARRPGGQRLVVVVTVAVALLSFAATAWDVAAQARRDHAEDALGAARVYSVVADHPAALAGAVTRADPDGHSMAVVRASQRYGDDTVELLGVQAGQLPAVATWRGHDRTEIVDLSQRLRPQVAEPLKLNGEVTVQVSVDVLPAKVPLRLAAVVGAAGEPPRAVQLGVLAKGVRDYRSALPPGCAAGCRLLGLSVARGVVGAEPITAALSVRGIRSGNSDLPAAFTEAGRWRVGGQRTGPAPATLRPGAALGIEVGSSDPADVLVEYVDTADALPAVLAGRAPADDVAASEFSFPGLAEQPLPFRVTARSPALPRAGSRGLLFDLDHAVRVAERSSSLADNNTLRYEVWAGARAPADLDARLAAGGVQVLRAETLSGYVDQLGRRAPALGLWLYLLAGAAAILLAVGVVLLTAYVGVRGRLYELAALRVSGVRPRVLRSAILREYRLVLGAPLVVGFLAGVVGAVVMLPGIPLVTAGTPGPVAGYRPGLGALPVALAATVVGFVLAVLLVLRMLRRATPDRLREGGV